MMLWKIEGEASDENGGGLTVVYTITRGPADYPDPDRALDYCDPALAWYSIRSIEQVGPVPMAWMEDRGPGSDFGDFVEGVGFMRELRDGLYRRGLASAEPRISSWPSGPDPLILPFVQRRPPHRSA